MKRSIHSANRGIRRLLAYVFAAGVLVAVMAATSTSARQPGGKTIKLIDDVRHPSSFQFVEPPPNPITGDPGNNAPGDAIITTNPLLDAKHKRIGTSYALLTFETGGQLPQKPSVLRNSLVYRLPGGAIFIEELNGPKVSFAVVTGGTGAYAGARGTVDQGKVFDVIHLLP
jgi:hypothetical protein